jgi:hypothetical protein
MRAYPVSASVWPRGSTRLGEHVNITRVAALSFKVLDVLSLGDDSMMSCWCPRVTSERDPSHIPSAIVSRQLPASQRTPEAGSKKGQTRARRAARRRSAKLRLREASLRKVQYRQRKVAFAARLASTDTDNARQDVIETLDCGRGFRFSVFPVLFTRTALSQRKV